MSRIELTQKLITSWGGPAVYAEAEAMVKRGEVLRAELNPPWLEGAILRSGGELRTRLKLLDGGMVESHCPCWSNREHGLICQHVVALAITILRRSTDPQREQRYREEQRRGRRAAASIPESFVRRPDGRPAQLRLMLPFDWQRQFDAGRVAVGFRFEIGGRVVKPDTLDRRQPLRLPPADDHVLAVLEDIAEDRLEDAVMASAADFLNILEVSRERTISVDGGRTLEVHTQAMQTHIRMDLDRENGELLVFAHTELPFLAPGEFPSYLVAGTKGWAAGAGHVWPLATVLPGPYHGIYRDPVVVPRPGVLRFLRRELAQLSTALSIETDIGIDLFSVDPGRPVFELQVRGSPASLAATLMARYDGESLIANDPAGEVAVPDPDDILHYHERNLAAEERALARLAAAGFRGERGDRLEPITHTRAVLNFLGGHVPALRRLGWHVVFEGRVAAYAEGLDMATPVVKVAETSAGWFDVGIDYEGPGGARIAAADVQRALLRGDAFLEAGGTTVLLDRDAVEAMRGVFQDCDGRDGRLPGHFELPAIYAPYVQSSLTAIDGIDVEEPPAWRQRAAQQNRSSRIEPVPLGNLEQTLRPYQKEGVYWLRFLERMGFNGILADEMGLGKTLQTLTWLRLERVRPEAAGRPALIICPTSLVENWAREAAQFTPERRCLVMAGSRRHDLWEQVPGHDLVITSYALLRRDLENYLAVRFSVVVLDEAQHIKNRSTQNAIAAKQLQTDGRLVLTGTPVENGVADVWSIMDFLMPGYLGVYDAFKVRYEQPISQGDRDGEMAQASLRRKLHPFLLRRMKRDVAKDLPDKILKTSYSCLGPDQQRVYDTLLHQFRQRIGSMVAERGFDRCRMEILTILMRLRQICCHLDLLPPELRGSKASDAPSAKMEQFFEVLDEAMDGGHRVLVFSQFVGLLQILRQQLEGRGLEYCYLDGQTKDRLGQVQRFNLQRNIPVFLISLKAGGTGLNLTGADMVIHFDPWWNPAVEDQATDRAHRIGQKRTVFSIKLITEHTVEEKVLALQQRKQQIIGATIGTTDESVMQKLTWEDVQDLLKD